MRKVFFYFLSIIIFLSCNTFEENHIPKKAIRGYLKETLHDPNSLEELSWDFIRHYVFKDVDSTDNNSALEIDYNATAQLESENIKITYIRLNYRGKNGFGALRKEDLYAIYYEDLNTIQFENGSYSLDLESYIPNKENDFHLNPKLQFLKTKYYIMNNGNARFEDFLKEYPEFD